MLRLTKETDYGVMILTHFAAQAREARLTARDLATRTHLSHPMISKVMKVLAKNGLLTSQRGAGGGYQLAKASSQISVADIIKAMEGPISLTVCTDEGETHCLVESDCPARQPWSVINQAIEEALGSIPLASMTKKPNLNQMVNIEAKL